MMELMLLLLLFAAVNHAEQSSEDGEVRSSEDGEVRCDATQGNRSECSVALGGTVSVQLMSNASGLILRCKKNHSTDPFEVFKVKKDKVTIVEALRNRTWFFVQNGTFQLRRAEWSDAGEYILEVFKVDGMLERKKHLQLSVTQPENASFPLLLVLVASGASAGLLLIVLVVMTTCCLCRKKKHPDSGQRLSSLK